MNSWQLAVFILLIVFVNTQTTTQQSGSLQIEYTQDLQTFKKVNQRGRMQILLGCWLMARQYSVTAMPGYRMILIKNCMRRISRKDSVTKITSLINKNLTQPKTYQQVVAVEQIPRQEFGPEQQPSEFDTFLSQFLEKYEKDLDGIARGNEGAQLRRKVQEQMEKRQKYYFGFIPANKLTHTAFLVGIAVLMIVCCTCWKYYARAGKKDEQKKSKESYFKYREFTRGSHVHNQNRKHKTH